MPSGIADAVRASQLPDTSVGQPFAPPGSMVSNKPVTVTPGFGGAVPGTLPPIKTGSGHHDITITFYMDQAAVEATTQGGFPGAPVIPGAP